MTGWRGRTLTAGMVLLYPGHVLTGMALPLAVAWPVTLALLLLYTVLMRPTRQWAANTAMLVLTLLVLGALALLLALAGGGLAWLAGLAPPAWAGPALALAGTALSRLAWSARRGDEMDAFLDQAIAAIRTGTPLPGAEPDAVTREPGPGDRRP